MHRALLALVLSCAATPLLVATAAVAEPVGALDLTAYASVADPLGGFDYIRLFPGNVVISHMDHALLTGVFTGDDYSTEYAIDDTATLVRIDTASGVVTPVGSLPGFDGAAHISLTVDTDSGAALALVARSPCTESDLYSVDLTNGTTTLIAPLGGCLQSMVFAPDGTLYALDRDTGDLAALTNGVVDIGSIGFTLDDADTLAYAPGGADFLLLFAFDPDLATNVLCTVDTSTGSTTFIGQIGGDEPIAAFALAAPLPETVFADGFDD